MNICDDKHPEVVYTTRYCPVCQKLEEIQSLENEIADLCRTIDGLKNEISQ